MKASEKEATKEPKFQSIVRRVVICPMILMTIVVCITIIASLVGYFNMRQQMINSNIASLQVSQKQLENLMEQIDHSYIEYWNSNQSFAYLKSYDQKTPKEVYTVNEADTGVWMKTLSDGYTQIQGIFGYFPDIDLYIFRGTSNYQMHQYLRERIKNNNDCYNQWELVNVDGKQYLTNIKKYNNFYGGVWLPVDELLEWLNVQNVSYRGQVYMVDHHDENTLKDTSLYDEIKQNGRFSQRVSSEHAVLYNYLAENERNDIYLGILISRTSLFADIPLLNKGIFLLAILSILVIPVIALWLRRKIAVPVQGIDDAMQVIGDGNTDFRIPFEEKPVYDEFDRLIVRFNQMMDKLNETEFNLYKSKISQQQTELRYISQQIRPHFILNVLNIIYTYEEDEFPLVKKMVLYLTEYFRYIVNLKVDFVEVEKELRHVENYLNIQKERYLDRFEFFVEWEAAAQKLLIPPLIIQTFVENCIKYAMKGDSKIFIFVLASIENDCLKLMIADTGNGFTDETQDKINAFLKARTHQEGLGVGIENAIERMDILYKQQVEVKLHNAFSGGAVVELYLPILSQAPQPNIENLP